MGFTKVFDTPYKRWELLSERSVLALYPSLHETGKMWLECSRKKSAPALTVDSFMINDNILSPIPIRPTSGLTAAQILENVAEEQYTLPSWMLTDHAFASDVDSTVSTSSTEELSQFSTSEMSATQLEIEGFISRKPSRVEIPRQEVADKVECETSFPAKETAESKSNVSPQQGPSKEHSPSDSKWTSELTGSSKMQQCAPTMSAIKQNTGSQGKVDASKHIPVAPKAMLSANAPSFNPAAATRQQPRSGNVTAQQHQAYAAPRQVKKVLNAQEMLQIVEQKKRWSGFVPQTFAGFDTRTQAQSSFEEQKELERHQRALQGRQRRRC